VSFNEIINKIIKQNIINEIILVFIILIHVLGLTYLVLGAQRAIDSQCEGISPGTFTASDKSCSHYYFCDEEGVATLLSCPPNFHFTETNQGCDWPSNVFNCPECENIPPNTFVASTESCNKYFYCDENGSAFASNCPDGYYFTQTEQGCAPSEFVTDCPVLNI